MRLAFILPLLLMACAKPNWLTDRQVELIAEQCHEHGQALKIFNSPIVSRAYCE
jgi:hypothetical protein